MTPHHLHALAAAWSLAAALDRLTRRAAPICAPDTPVDEAARILARYV